MGFIKLVKKESVHKCYVPKFRNIFFRIFPGSQWQCPVCNVIWTKNDRWEWRPDKYGAVNGNPETFSY